jgi:hypothetical protein
VVIANDDGKGRPGLVQIFCSCNDKRHREAPHRLKTRSDYSSSSLSSSASASHLMNGSAAFLTFLLISFATYCEERKGVSLSLEHRGKGEKGRKAHLLADMSTPLSENLFLENVGLVERH